MLHWKRIVLGVWLIGNLSLITNADDSLNIPPLVKIYANTDSVLHVDNVAVSITNRRQDVAILLTSLEFEGQLPELRYFYHGLYGGIRKEEDQYIHNTMLQSLSPPVGFCLLLPGQSLSWQRPLRILTDGYIAHVTWQEIPRDRLSTNVWFHIETHGFDEIYQRFSKEGEWIYRNISAAKHSPPYVILEGEFPEYSTTLTVPCDIPCTSIENGECVRSDHVKGYPEGSVEFRLHPLADSIVVTQEKVIFREYDAMQKHMKVLPGPDISPRAIDFLALRFNSQEQTIPCIMQPEDFGDLLDVHTAFTKMYYHPGITDVPCSLFSKVFQRAQERQLSITLHRIDPNSLGMKYVLSIGVTVDRRGEIQ